MIVVHVTHEAVEKIGGIGAVIAGLMTADAYQESVTRTILVGPLLTTDRPVNRRLGEHGKVLYSSLDAIDSPPWRELFRPIEKTYDVGIIYGTREVVDACSQESVEAEVLLVDVFHANRDRLNLFKAELYKKFSVPSRQFEHIWEYEQYVRLAEPAFEALRAIGAHNGKDRTLLLAHEYMGMPTALRAVLAGPTNTRTVFYAHEVASVRPIVELHPGHDTMFYNAMCFAAEQDRTLEQAFPEVLDNFKHALVKAARYCDHVFAVGDYIEGELRFIDPHFRTMDIDLVYNGIPASPLSLADKNASLDRMKQYAENLFGAGRRPTWIFTHVARPVLSKGIWRDLRVLHELEPILADRGESAVLFMLGTLAGQRRSQDIRHMERVYGWPVHHEAGYPDLCQGEESLGGIFEAFNKDHRAIQAVYVNQWDWHRSVCGERMPEEMTFADIRQGTDVEFGLSIYEPFGIAQFEPLSFGAICLVSNVCGCMGFVRAAHSEADYAHNIVQADYLQLPPGYDPAKAIDLPGPVRETIEVEEGKRLARLIDERLPRSDEQRSELIAGGFGLAGQMDWEHVVRGYFLPSLSRAVERH